MSTGWEAKRRMLEKTLGEVEGTTLVSHMVEDKAK